MYARSADPVSKYHRCPTTQTVVKEVTEHNITTEIRQMTIPCGEVIARDIVLEKNDTHCLVNR